MINPEDAHAAGAKEAISAVGGLFDGFSDVMKGDLSQNLGVGRTEMLATPAKISPYRDKFNYVKMMNTGYNLNDFSDDSAAVFAATLEGRPNSGAGRYAVFLGLKPADIDGMQVNGDPLDPYLFMAYEATGSRRLLVAYHTGASALTSQVVHGKQLPQLGAFISPPNTFVTHTMLFRHR